MNMQGLKHPGGRPYSGMDTVFLVYLQCQGPLELDDGKILLRVAHLYEELCGNRTELYNLCSRYIRLRERISHESRCNGVPNIPVEFFSIEGVLILFLQNEVKGSTSTYLKTKIMGANNYYAL